MRFRAIAFAAVSVVGVAGLAAGTYALGRRATRTVTVQPAPPSRATVTARSGMLEETRPMSVSAQWQDERPLLGRLAGTVTSVGLSHERASAITEGTVLYTVDDRPVLVVTGGLPAFRSIDFGTKGRDVEQIQEFLERVGFPPGAVDGTWGSSSSAAWTSWRRSIGLPEASTIELGEVLFVPGLPRLIASAEGLVVGGVLAASDKVASLLLPSPLVFADVTKDAAGTFAPGIPVDLGVGSLTVTGTLTSRRTTTETGVRIELDVGTGCATWCVDIAVGSPTSLRGIAHLTPPVSGTVVPIGALRTGTGDGAAVVLADGRTIQVTVRAKVGAEAVVDGVAPGDKLELPGSPASPSPST